MKSWRRSTWSLSRTTRVIITLSYHLPERQNTHPEKMPGESSFSFSETLLFVCRVPWDMNDVTRKGRAGHVVTGKDFSGWLYLWRSVSVWTQTLVLTTNMFSCSTSQELLWLWMTINTFNLSARTNLKSISIREDEWFGWVSLIHMSG